MIFANMIFHLFIRIRRRVPRIPRQCGTITSNNAGAVAA
jgi:hypothetical protein